jgi:uncharacterized DUF497 family protein
VFLWDDRKATRNSAKHGVTFAEAATVFADADALDWEDSEHSLMEQRSKRLGRSIRNRILLVVYTLRRRKNEKETIRIISARQASRRERKAYARPED